MCDDFDEWIGTKKIRAITDVSTFTKSGRPLWGRNCFDLLKCIPTKIISSKIYISQ